MYATALAPNITAHGAGAIWEYPPYSIQPVKQAADWSMATHTKLVELYERQHASAASDKPIDAGVALVPILFRRLYHVAPLFAPTLSLSLLSSPHHAASVFLDAKLASEAGRSVKDFHSNIANVHADRARVLASEPSLAHTQPFATDGTRSDGSSLVASSPAEVRTFFHARAAARVGALSAATTAPGAASAAAAAGSTSCSAGAAAAAATQCGLKGVVGTCLPPVATCYSAPHSVGGDLPNSVVGVIGYTAPAVNPEVYLPWLQHTAQAAGVRVEAPRPAVSGPGHVAKLAREYRADVVVNATGIGAREVLSCHQAQPRSVFARPCSAATSCYHLAGSPG